MDDPRYPRGFDAEVLTGSTLSEAVNTYAVSATFLPDKSTAAADAMYGSFRDSIEYDMRGRLVRAYPSFQMFIIDEGRWTFWYKLWDNLYGYNAIQSIDLIRNREIVADTLVMQMTNVYNNLSTKSSIYDDIDDSFTILNLFSGSSKDRTDAWQTIWGIANDDIIQARAEHLDTMMLKAGARIHLRLGYGSNPDNIPIVFNGTITEMDSQEIITVVAQSDGVELTSKLHNKPNDTNARFFDLDIDEPRLLICKMMSTKGSWFQDVINKTSLGQFFKNNPNSVVHFGDVTTVPPALCKLPLFQRSDDDWGEVGFNIYCANGHETFSQWICYGKIDKSNDFKNYDGLTWGKEPYTVNNGNYSQWVGEPKIKLYLYDKTIWDVVNILTDAVPDYICAVHPFELRSTLFYGKPMFGLAYKYGYLFRINQDTKQLQRIITNGF
jgi:hypothetical protein